MLKSLPVAEPSQLFRIGDTDECCTEGWEEDEWSLFLYPLVQRLTQEAPEFEEVTAFQANADIVGARSSLKDSAARPLKMEYVDGHYFHVLGINPYAGRLLQLSDDQRTVQPVTRGLRPAKVDENGFENEAFLKAVGAAKVGVTVELLRPLTCLIRSMRVERINGRSLCSRGATIARDPA